MTTVLRSKNQITLPASIIKKMNLKKDANLKIEVNKEGQIIMTPITFVETALIADLKEAIKDIETGNVSKAMSADDLIKKLGL